MMKRSTNTPLADGGGVPAKETCGITDTEDNYRTIFNALNDAIMIHDAETGRPLHTNPKMAELLGYSVEEILQMQVSDWSVGESKQVQNNAIQKIKNAALGNPQLFEWQVRTKDNRQIWLEVNLIAATIGETKRVLAVVRDATVRKKAEKELRDSEQKYRDLVESTSDWVWEVDCDGVYTYSSPKVQDLIGYPPEEVIGKTPFDFMAQKEAQRVFDLFSKIISKQERLNALENTNIHKNGTEVVLETSAIPIFNVDGEWVGYRGIDRDITDRKISEKERTELVSQLNHARKMESIGTLAGGVAHDFNNLLYVIIGNAELALEDIPDWNPVYSSVEEIRDAGLKAAGIVKQLLNFSRKDTPEMRPIGSVTVIGEAIRFLRSTIPANIAIRADLQEEDMTILADPVQINQLIMNICINAAQAMENTTGAIEICVDHTVISEETTDYGNGLRPGKYLRITIGDTGPGIREDIIDRIFEPYFTTKDIGEGSGMGLAVVHGIVKSHHGVITADSLPGEGATFKILLPLAARNEQISVKRKDLVPGGSETILLVDDEESIVRMVKRMLESLGYHVKACTDPVKALSLFQSEVDLFDLVITDMTMPELTGDRLAAQLLKIKKGLPIVLCTGFNQTISEGAAKEIGIRSFAYKPIVKSELAVTIRRALDGIPNDIHRSDANR